MAVTSLRISGNRVSRTRCLPTLGRAITIQHHQAQELHFHGMTRWAFWPHLLLWCGLLHPQFTTMMKSREKQRRGQRAQSSSSQVFPIKCNGHLTRGKGMRILTTRGRFPPRLQLSTPAWTANATLQGSRGQRNPSRQPVHLIT